jgi:molecular chaperone DnaK
VTNITTHTLGVVLWDHKKLEEYVFPMIKKMTGIPKEAKTCFGTVKPNMKSVGVRVVEGESSVPSECTELGLCNIDLPPFLPKGSPINLTYCYNANQVLEVTVEAFEKQNRVCITRNGELSDLEVTEASADLAQLVVL